MPQEYNNIESWIELGQAGEQKVLAAIPKGFTCFQNILVPCVHGLEFEEIDIVAVGPTGIWSIEVKNWRGIAYPGDYPEELVFYRRTPDGNRTSYRFNPYHQAQSHTQDLFSYLSRSIGKWFPPIHNIVVFVKRDNKGRNGVNLNRVLKSNPSYIYLYQIPAVLLNPMKNIRAWDDKDVIEALGKLRTWNKGG